MKEGRVNEKFSIKVKQNRVSAVLSLDKEIKSETKPRVIALTSQRNRANTFREMVMLKIRARNLGQVAFLCVQGQIVNGETETLRKAVQSLSEALSVAQPDVSTVVLDLALVSTVDAGGLGVLLELRDQVQAKGIGFKLMNVSRLIGRVLEVTRLDSVFEVTSGVEFFPAVSRRRPASAMGLASCA